MINLYVVSVTSTNLWPDHVGAVLALWRPGGGLSKSHPHGNERKLHFLWEGPASTAQRCEGHPHRQQGQTGKSTHNPTSLSLELLILIFLISHWRIKTPVEIFFFVVILHFTYSKILYGFLKSQSWISFLSKWTSTSISDVVIAFSHF